MYHPNSPLCELLVSIVPSSFSQAVLAFAIIFVGFIILPLLRWVFVARRSKIPFVIVPWYSYNQPIAFLLSRFLLKYINIFLTAPAGVVSWRRLTQGTWPLKLRHAPFTHLKSDSFWTVAPGGLVLNTADASVIHDIILRDSEFPKATQIYKGIGIYGQNVVSSSGSIWKHHRSFATKAFSDNNNRLVWRDTIDRIQDAVEVWTKTTVHNIQHDTSRISLEVMGRAAVGQTIDWQHGIEVGDDARSLARGCTMTFSDALKSVATNAMAIAALRNSWIPWWILKCIPVTAQMCQSYDEWGIYMNEMIITRRSEMNLKPSSTSAVDLLDVLCESQESQSLTDSEVLGNLFVFIIAGHETSANTLQMIIILLASHPTFQQEIQKELDEVFRGRLPSEWTFEHDYSALCNCPMLVAAMNEELRLISPILTIPKAVCSTAQQLEINGQPLILPAGTIVRLCVPSVHKDARYWPHGPPTYSSHPRLTFDNFDNDLEEFNPRRWMEDYKSIDNMRHSPTYNNHLFSPFKGSFLPFSAGSRSCLGQKFAKVEILVALAVIFSSHSIELATDEFASDLEVASMTSEQKRKLWNVAADSARDKWQNKLSCAFTVQLDEDVPLRFVKRGEEHGFYM